MKVDLLVRNATVITLDDDTPRARSLAIHHGRVVALDEALPARHSVDLAGATVVPGLGDAHNHMAWFGLSLDEIDLIGVDSLDTVYGLVADKAADLPSDALVVGSGYDDNLLGAHPDRERLDAAAAGRPVWLKHRSGHLCTVNTPLLQRIGVFDGRESAPGGVIVRDGSGAPTGVLQEQAQNLVVAEVTPYSLDRLAGALLAAGRRYAAEGLTHVTECGVGGGWLGKSPLEVAAYTMARDAALPVRVRLMPSVDALHPIEGHSDDPMTFGLDLGLTTGFGDDLVRLGPMKIWTDGSLLGRTAAMREDFCGCRQRGYLQDDPDRMRRQIVAAHRGGWDVAAHAIGDAGVDFALDAFEQAQRESPRPDARHRIEHAGVVNPDQIPRFAQLGVTPVPQARFLYDIGDSMCAAVGDERADWLYRHAGFLAAGVRVPGSSDRPVAGGAPLAGIESMVLRSTSSGRVVGPSERVDATTALRAYTLDAAWIAREEHTRGSLTPGKYADFVVLGDDITAIDPQRIGGTEVVATVLAGLATHDPNGTGLPPRLAQTDTP